MKITNCIKCESGALKDSYNIDTGHLARACTNCGFVWEELSADTQPELSKLDRMVDEKTK